MRTGPVPFSHAYTYDHNGNRLTKAVNGSLVQSFTYDGHDKLTGGAGSGESESYDLNGNLTAQAISGQTTHFTWDDEDRLTSQTFPDGHTDSYTYTGLGMRLTRSATSGTTRTASLPPRTCSPTATPRSRRASLRSISFPSRAPRRSPLAFTLSPDSAIMTA